MANSTSHILPYPIKNARYTLPLSFRTSAGTPTDPTTPDTEISTDGGATFSDATEEVTTGGSNGAGYLTLTGAETNNNFLHIAAKSANCLTTPATVVPRNLPILESGTASAGAAGTITLASGTYTGLQLAGCFIRTTGGTGGGGTGGANNQARRITSYNTSTRVATVTPNWETTPDNTTTYDILLPEGILVPMLTALAPTTLARTLDVSSGGEAGLDWANIGSPTTTVNLSGTSTKALEPATAGRTLVVDAAGLADANVVKIGPSGSGVATTAALCTNLKTIYDTDYATVYDTTNKAFLSKLGNFAMGGSSLALTTGAISCTTITASGAVEFQSTFAVTGTTTFAALTTSGTVTFNAFTVSNATTLSGAVSLGSTLGVTGTTTLAALTTTGTVTMNALTVSNATTLTGAVSATNASNDIRGITVASMAAATGLASIRSNTAAGGAAGTLTLDGSASATTDFYKGLMLVLTGGTGAGQSRLVTAYNGSTKVATVSWNWTTTPDNTTTFALLPVTDPSVNSSLQVSTTASDPWSTALPGAYSAGTAGYIIGTNLDTTVSSRVPTSGLPSNFGSLVINGSGGVTVGSLQAGVVTTTSIADGAITAAKFTSVFPTNFASLSITAGGIVKSDLQTILATAVTEGASGRLAGSFTTLFNVASPVLTAASVNQTGDNYARLGAPAGASIAADIASNKTDLTTLTGRLTSTRAGYLDNLSGGAVALASGVVLTSAGLDNVLVESGISASSSLTNDAGSQLTSINARQALALVASAAAAGVLSGAATTTTTIKPAGLPSGNTRITATVDADGNRSAMVLKVPT